MSYRAIWHRKCMMKFFQPRTTVFNAKTAQLVIFGQLVGYTLDMRDSTRGHGYRSDLVCYMMRYLERIQKCNWYDSHIPAVVSEMTVRIAKAIGVERGRVLSVLESSGSWRRRCIEKCDDWLRQEEIQRTK